MILRLAFEDFISKISLDNTRSKKIQTAHNAIRDFLAEDEEIKLKFYESFLQGSYRLFTAVRPQGDGEYDVDAILSLSLNNSFGTLRGAPEVITWVAERLRNNERYKNKVAEKTKCVRVNYADGFHMDIVTAHCSGDTDGILLVPPTWKESNPKGFREWCVKRHEKSGEYFYSVVKMLKWWRNIHFGDDGSPKSILHTTLIGQNIPSQSSSLDKALLKTMENINVVLKPHFIAPEIKNPSLETEVISSSWTSSDFSLFKTKLNEATELVKKALSEKDEEKTIELWNSEALFNGTFPKTIRGIAEEAKRFGEELGKGALGISQGGLVTTSISKPYSKVPPTRFYGGF